MSNPKPSRPMFKRESKGALTTGSKTAAASRGSESCFHGLLEPLCVRQQAWGAPEPFLGERKPPAASHKAAPVAHGNSSQSHVMQQPF